MYNDFVFGKDVFLKTDHPVAVDSEDGWSPPVSEDQPTDYFGKPLSFVCDFWSGEALACELLRLYPGKDRLLDLGTATGSVPLTMRRVGMRALGLDGLDAGKRGEIEPHMLRGREALFAWREAPEIVDCCDITKPFQIEDAAGRRAQFDFIISTDCFEHLVTERVPQMLDNVYDHLAPDGFGIFEISTGAFAHIHQTVKPIEWWRDIFSTRFVIDDVLSQRDFAYVRSRVEGKQIRYVDSGVVDGYKILFWVRKRPVHECTAYVEDYLRAAQERRDRTVSWARGR